MADNTQQNGGGLVQMGMNTVRMKRAYDEDALAKAVVGEPIEDFQEWVAKNYPDQKIVKAAR